MISKSQPISNCSSVVPGLKKILERTTWDQHFRKIAIFCLRVALWRYIHRGYYNWLVFCFSIVSCIKRLYQHSENFKNNLLNENGNISESFVERRPVLFLESALSMCFIESSRTDIIICEETFLVRWKISF